MTGDPNTGEAGAPTRRRRGWLVVAAMAGVAALGFTLANGLRPDPGASTAATDGTGTQLRNDPAPALTANTLDGQPFDLRDLRGQVVIVNVLASWCAPCRAELPLLADTARRWSAEGLRVVGIAMRDTESSVRTLLTDTGADDLPVILDQTGEHAVRWGAAGVPETFLVDRDGQIRARALGAVTPEWIDRHVVPLVRS